MATKQAIKNSSTDILLFAEDPGAANFLIPVYSCLLENGLTVKVLVAGIAEEYFGKSNIPYETICSQNKAADIFDQINPKVLITGTACNPDTMGLLMIDVAKKRGILSISVVDAIMNAELRFCGRTENCMAYVPDWVLVPEEGIKREFVGLGISKDRILVCGHPHYDYLLEKKKLFDSQNTSVIRAKQLPEAPPEQKVVVFACEGSVRISPINQEELAVYTFRGRGFARGRTEIVMEEFLDALTSMGHQPYLILRIHPKDCMEDYALYLSEFDLVSQGGDPLELLYASDLVVGMTSMLLQEAVVLGVPVLSIVPRLIEKEWLPTVRSGITACVTTREELKNQLELLLSNGGSKNKIQTIIDQGSSKRIVAFIKSEICARKLSEGNVVFNNA